MFPIIDLSFISTDNYHAPLEVSHSRGKMMCEMKRFSMPQSYLNTAVSLIHTLMKKPLY